MNSLKKITANVLDWSVKKAGSRALSVARVLTPLPVKRRLSRFLTKEVALDTDFVKTTDGHRFVALQEPVFLQVRYEGTYEKDLSAIARQLVGKGDTVVDVGANFGWYTILMAAGVGETGRVFSYEPNKAIYPVLTKNIALNEYEDRIALTKCGIGEKKEKVILSAGDDESAIGYFDKNKTGDESEGIEIHPLDDLLADQIGNISFIKIDVEGFEPFVLRGAQKILSCDTPPAILMEFNIEALERQDIDIDDFITDLTSLNATIAKVVRGKLIKMDSIPKANENLFFIPSKGRYSREINSLNS